jgi:hypothetical protein
MKILLNDDVVTMRREKDESSAAVLRDVHLRPEAAGRTVGDDRPHRRLVVDDEHPTSAKYQHGRNGGADTEGTDSASTLGNATRMRGSAPGRLSTEMLPLVAGDDSPDDAHAESRTFASTW